jgi:phospholipid/cholesterol/gamma-HCH transport system permease protein
MKRISNKLISVLDDTGARILDVIDLAGFCIVIFFETLPHLSKIWSKRREIINQMYIAGIKSFPVNVVVSLFTGMILALQTGIELRKFGQEALIGNLVIATLTREMAPFVSAIVLIASVGSAIAAEIATMKVSEEIDALEMMSISPLRFLVMPRLVSLCVMFPISAVYFTVIGTFGGAIIAYYKLNMQWGQYYIGVLDGLHFKATYVGLLKSFIFGLVVALVSSAYGLRATNGMIGVGNATRSSVIASLLMVLMLGYFVTAMFFGR